MIETELQENPAMEWLDEGLHDLHQEEIFLSIAPQELKPGSEDREFQRSRQNDAEETDWLDFAATFDSLEDHLEGQLHSPVNEKIWPALSILIASLDERGYLATPLEEIALDHNLDYEMVECALSVLQACEPAGVGARNLQECLALQLRFAETEEAHLAHQIVTEAFDDLVSRNVRSLMRHFKAVPSLIQAAFDEILQLTPHPAEGFSRAQQWSSRSRSVSVPTDLILHRTEQGWDVEVPGIGAQDLVVNRMYRERMEAVAKRKDLSDEHRHLATYVQRAKTFIESLRQRGATLRRIGHYLIEHQSGYVMTGDVAFLKSLTRRKLAADLELHESTISRATAGKHVRLANGEVVSFDVFFKPALRVQQMIAEILATEKPGEPLSDEKIAAMLAERGVEVARRTVNKYRDRSKMLSSRRRRTA